MKFKPMGIKGAGESRSKTSRTTRHSHARWHAGSIFQHLFLESIRYFSLSQLSKLSLSLLTFQLQFETLPCSGAIHAGKLIVQHRIHGRRAESKSALDVSLHTTRRETRMGTSIFTQLTQGRGIGVRTWAESIESRRSDGFDWSGSRR